MTKDEILSKEPGPELNLIVCRDVMGYEVINGGVVIKQGEYLKPFSEDIAVAWEVVEKADLPFGISKSYDTKIGYGYTVNWCDKGYECINCDSDCFEKKEIICKTAPEAICKAELIAMMEANNESN